MILVILALWKLRALESIAVYSFLYCKRDKKNGSHEALNLNQHVSNMLNKKQFSECIMKSNLFHLKRRERLSLPIPIHGDTLPSQPLVYRFYT